MNALRDSSRRTKVLVAVATAVILAALPMAASAAPKPSDGPTPIVLFPAWHFTRLELTVHNQHVDPTCPSSGTFEDLVGFDPGPTFSQVCRDELSTLRYDPNPHKPMPPAVLRTAWRQGGDRRLRPDVQCAVLRADVPGARGGRLHARPRHPRRRLRRSAHPRHGRLPPAVEDSSSRRRIGRTAGSRSTSSGTRTGRSTSSTC